MAAPPVYLDECVDVDLATGLARRGFRATTTRAQARSGATDEAQLEFAGARGWILLSHNKRHFVRWHQTFQRQKRRHSGIIILPKSPLPRLELRAAMALDWIEQSEQLLTGRLVLRNEIQSWLNRHGPLHGYSAL